MKEFEQSQLTKDILNTIAIALEYLPESHLKEKMDKLFDKIQEDKLDVRFVSRDY